MKKPFACRMRAKRPRRFVRSYLLPGEGMKRARKMRIVVASKVKNSHAWSCSGDILNRCRYGRLAPRYAEPIVVAVSEEMRHVADLPGPGRSGAVQGGDWYKRSVPVTHIENVRFCLLRWRFGYAWEDTGAFERMERLIAEKGSMEGCQNMREARARYERLDEIFEQVKREGRLRRVRELGERRIRARGDACFHIGPGGEPFFAGFGCHRLGMALALGFSEIPAQVGCVHPDGLAAFQRVRVWGW